MRSSVALLILLVCMPCVAVPDSPTAILVGDSTMVPMRAVFEWLNANVTYRGGKITAVRGTDTVCLTVGSRQASVNGRTVALPTQPVFRDGTTYVPLRFVGESMGAGVEYDGPRKKVTIRDAGRVLNIPVVEADPVKLAMDVFRSYIATVNIDMRLYSEYRGRTPVFFDPKAYTWVREEMKRSGWFFWDVDPNFDTAGHAPQLARQFTDLLHSVGWSKGAAWFPYQIVHRSANKVQVDFLEWNWGTSVYIQRSEGVWRPTHLEADGEGNEDSPPLKWTVTRSGSTYSFKKAR